MDNRLPQSKEFPTLQRMTVKIDILTKITFKAMLFFKRVNLRDRLNVPQSDEAELTKFLGYYLPIRFCTKNKLQNKQFIIYYYGVLQRGIEFRTGRTKAVWFGTTK